MSVELKHQSHDETLASSADSDDLQKFIYSSASNDRSSVGSIPWAEDAIKQNKQEWLRIERMFYGEEAFAENDPELCREINEWTEAFPHLRVVGKRVKSGEMSLSVGDNEELASEDNHKQFAATSHISVSPKNGNLMSSSFIIHPEAKSIFFDMGLSSLLERDLRINSVPMLSKRRQQFTQLPRTEYRDLPWKHPATYRRPPLPQKAMSGRVNMRRQMFPSNSSNLLIPSTLNDNDQDASHALTNMTRSAKIIRIPPIINLIMPVPSPHTKYFTSSDASQTFFVTHGTEMRKQPSTSKLQERLVLPVLNLAERELFMQRSRSISAADRDGKMRPAAHLSNSASKLKIWK